MVILTSNIILWELSKLSKYRKLLHYTWRC